MGDQGINIPSGNWVEVCRYYFAHPRCAIRDRHETAMQSHEIAIKTLESPRNSLKLPYMQCHGSAGANIGCCAYVCGVFVWEEYVGASAPDGPKFVANCKMLSCFC